MSRRHPYSIVPITPRRETRRDWLPSAVVFTTGLMVGIAVMSILGVLSVQ